ncbi:hypothetical protein E3E22_07370 [Thermococcus sp. MV5]|uniref:hypothetical protein n=1 Tax=Thermococcus sp. MV5 TaxID=1638272 RepID=UPI00143943DF|nr:hypothetical protein [Thermococcus sp. MV5]NJE26436.1 hypothetical protein [Thermococcus sp. MV5]
MGMFDYVHIHARCPVCEHKIKNFQTKSLENMLEHYRVGDTVNIDKIYAYTSCPSCHSFIDIEIKVENGKITERYDVISVKRSWIVEMLEEIGEKTILTLYEGKSSGWEKVISLNLNKHEAIGMYNILKDLFLDLHTIGREIFLPSKNSRLYKVCLEEPESEKLGLTCASCGMPLTEGDLKVKRDLLIGESYYEFTCPFCGASQKAELKKAVDLKVKSPMKRAMKQLLESETVKLIFYRERYNGVRAFMAMETSGKKAPKIYGFIRGLIKLRGEIIEESRIGNLPVWMILWRRKDEHVLFIAIRKKSKHEG